MNKIKSFLKSFLEQILDTCFHEWEEYSIWEPYQENSDGEYYCEEVFYKRCWKCGKQIKLK